MIKIKSKYKLPQGLLGHVVLAALLACGACTNDNNACIDEPAHDKQYHLQFAISTQMSDTHSRVADIAGDVLGSPAENYINVAGGDLQFLLFDGERRFIQELSLTDVQLVYTASDYVEYIFHAPVTAQYFKDNINTTFSFYIMALANGHSMGMTYPVPTTGQTIEQIAEGRRAANTGGALLSALPITNQLIEIGQWYPQCFPMAGLQKFTVSGADLKKSTEAIPCNISANGKDINMLRALAKIEIIDHANFTGKYNESTMGNDINRIDKVELSGYVTAGAIIPAISEWTNDDADETQQVDNPTVPTSASYHNPPKMTTPVTADGDMIDLLPDTYAKRSQTDNCNVFSGYVYEYDMAKLQTGQQTPYLRITTKGKQSDNDTEGSHVIPMLMAEYTNGMAGQPVASLLRNHIYRFQINGINNDANLTVQWTVCPMDQASITIPPFQ